MDYRYSLKLNLFFGNSKDAKIAHDSASVDMGNAFELRSKTTVKLKKDMLAIDIKAKDLTALRASLNSYLKSIALSINLLEVF